MLKYTAILLLTGSSLIASASTTINWGQYAAGNAERTAVNFTTAGSNQHYTTFQNVNGSGIDLRVNVAGAGFVGASIQAAQYGFSQPAYSNGVRPNLGLVFNTKFAAPGQGLTVTFEFYSAGEQIAVDGLSLGIHGIGVGNANYQHPQWGLQDYRDVVSNISGSFDGDTVHGRKDNLIPVGSDPSDYLSVSTGSDINNKTNAAAIPNSVSEYAFQQGLYYGTGQDWGGADYTGGNISVAYNAPLESISFTFGASNDSTVKAGSSVPQSFAIGNVGFGNEFVIDHGGNTVIPEPSTYAMLLALGVVAAVIIRRRK